jgi:hypothetical protein
MRDNTQASELFELCKEVYKRFPEWNDTLAVYEQTAGIPEGKPYIAYPELERKWGLWGTQELKKHTPLYTSNYLLEKLQQLANTDRNQLHLFTNTNNGYSAKMTISGGSYGEEDYHWYEISDGYRHRTPILALLKLTIALSEAGELK